MKTAFIFILLCFFFVFTNAQKTLQILKIKPGSFKKYEVYSGDVLEYKLKGNKFYHKNLIVNMNDSVIVFKNDSMIKLSDLKVIKLHNGNHLMGTFVSAFLIAGIGYASLNVINNLLIESVFRLDPKAMIVSASFLTAAIILKQISIKRIHMRRNVSLKVLDLNFQKLN